MANQLVTEVYTLTEDECKMEEWTLVRDAAAHRNPSNTKPSRQTAPTGGGGGRPDSQWAATLSGQYGGPRHEPSIAACPPADINYIVTVEPEASGRDTIIRIVKVKDPSSEEDTQPPPPPPAPSSSSSSSSASAAAAAASSSSSRTKRKSASKKGVSSLQAPALATIHEQDLPLPSSTDGAAKIKKRKRKPVPNRKYADADGTSSSKAPPAKKRKTSGKINSTPPVPEEKRAPEVGQEQLLEGQEQKRSGGTQSPFPPADNSGNSAGGEGVVKMEGDVKPPLFTDGGESGLKTTSTKKTSGGRIKGMCVCTCGMMFSHRSGLSRHRRIVHLGMTYRCEVCGEHFTRSDSLNDHMRRMQHFSPTSSPASSSASFTPSPSPSPFSSSVSAAAAAAVGEKSLTDDLHKNDTFVVLLADENNHSQQDTNSNSSSSSNSNSSNAESLRETGADEHQTPEVTGAHDRGPANPASTLAPPVTASGGDVVMERVENESGTCEVPVLSMNEGLSS